MHSCRGCGADLDPTQDQVNAAVEQVLEISLDDARKRGGVCPLCGHSKQVPYWRRKTVVLGSLLACLLLTAAINFVIHQHTETSTPFYKATIGWNGNGWTTRLADGSVIRFPEAYNGKSMAQGAPTEMRDAKGNVLELRRDAQRNLQEIRTPHDHWIRFNYDDLSRIVWAYDDAGKWAGYSYNSEGMLTHVVSSSGWQRHFQYDGKLMRQVSDEKGRVLIRNWYDSWTLVRQQFANGATYSYRYQWSANRRHPEKVLVTSPDGTRRDVWVADSIPESTKKAHD